MARKESTHIGYWKELITILVEMKGGVKDE